MTRSRIGLGLVAGTLTCVLVGCGGKKLAEQAEAVRRAKAGGRAEVSTTAAELVAAYKANEVRADENFKGKVVRVSGEVRKIEKDLGGHPVVVLTPGGKAAWVNVRCVLDKGEARRAADLDKGRPATVWGVVTGKLGAVHLAGGLLE